MKVTTLLGSAKKKGNTATVLGWVEEELKASGHDVERIYLHNKAIKGCIGCAKCRDYPDEGEKGRPAGYRRRGLRK